MIGLCGAHATGKTTLAKAWAEQNDVPYVSISTRDLMAQMSVTNADLSANINLRIAFQQRMVRSCYETFSRQRTLFISDRTPLDVAAYMLADVQQGQLNMDQQKAVLTIVEDCLDITNLVFGALIYIRPMLPYIEEPGRPAADFAYQALHGHLVQGLLADYRLKTDWWHLSTVPLEKRLAELDEIHDTMVEDVVNQGHDPKRPNPTFLRNV